MQMYTMQCKDYISVSQVCICSTEDGKAVVFTNRNEQINPTPINMAQKAKISGIPPVASCKKMSASAERRVSGMRKRERILSWWSLGRTWPLNTRMTGKQNPQASSNNCKQSNNIALHGKKKGSQQHPQLTCSPYHSVYKVEGRTVLPISYNYGLLNGLFACTFKNRTPGVLEVKIGFHERF